MGNTPQKRPGSDAKAAQINSASITQVYDQVVGLLSSVCTDDQFPLSAFRSTAEESNRHRLIEIITAPRKSDEFSNILVQLHWNDRPTISKQEVEKLFCDCCIFDLKQATVDKNHFSAKMLDKECFSALANNITPSTTADIGHEQFYQWMRVNFPTLFYGFEMWLRKQALMITKESPSHGQSKLNMTLMTLNNVLNETWIWLLTHHLPILYLSSDNTCTNLFERMTSVLHGRMWDHLYNSQRDGSSLNRFQHHIFGYKAPIIILFETSDGYLFCLCCDEAFRESPKHFGGIQSCLLQLKPVFKVVLEGPGIIFMNTKLRGLSSIGLCVGRDHTHTFVNIDSDLFNIKHINGEGRIAAIDVWGVGGKKSAEEQEDMRAWEDKQVEKSRKVKRSFEEEEAILNMAGIETRHTQDQF